MRRWGVPVPVVVPTSPAVGTVALDMEKEREQPGALVVVNAASANVPKAVESPFEEGMVTTLEVR